MNSFQHVNTDMDLLFTITSDINASWKNATEKKHIKQERDFNVCSNMWGLESMVDTRNVSGQINTPPRTFFYTRWKNNIKYTYKSSDGDFSRLGLIHPHTWGGDTNFGHYLAIVFNGRHYCRYWLGWVEYKFD